MDAYVAYVSFRLGPISRHHTATHSAMWRLLARSTVRTSVARRSFSRSAIAKHGGHDCGDGCGHTHSHGKPRDGLQFPELDEKQMQDLINNPLIQKLAKSPRTLEKLKETTMMMADKGYIGELSMLKQVKLMMDREVRNKMLDLRKTMDDDGIDLRQEDMAGLFEIMGLQDFKK